jgi:hypothetical protein
MMVGQSLIYFAYFTSLVSPKENEKMKRANIRLTFFCTKNEKKNLNFYLSAAVSP